MVSVDIYLNETTRHADVILPGCRRWRTATTTSRSRSSRAATTRATAPPVFAPPRRPPAGVAEPAAAGRDRRRAAARGADVLALDDELVAADVRKRRRRARGRGAGRPLAGLRGPERLLDLALRGGPYGDGFGLKPDGLTLARVRAAPGGIDLGPLAAARARSCCARPAARSSSRRRCCSPTCRAPRPTSHAPAAALVVIGRRDVRINNSWMHNLPTLAKGPERCTAARPPGRRRAARPGRRRHARAAARRAPATSTSTVELSDEHDARRGQPAARLGPRPARHAAGASRPSGRARTSTRCSTRRCAIRCRAMRC